MLFQLSLGGRPEGRQCRAACNKAETLNHVVQQCHRTHGGRIKRHDAVVSYVSRSLVTQGYKVSVEPKIVTEADTRKLDIIAKLGITTLVLDAQVVNDQIDLDVAHQSKINYYKTIEKEVKEVFVQNVIFSSITLSWRGL